MKAYQSGNYFIDFQVLRLSVTNLAKMLLNATRKVVNFRYDFLCKNEFQGWIIPIWLKAQQ